MGTDGPASRSGSVRRWAPQVAVLVIVVGAAFAPSLAGDMLSWDDGRIVADNPLVGPPYLAHTAAMFTRIQNEAYQPLHVASYQIDHALWGLDPAGCHAFNLLLYLAAVCVLYALLAGMDAGRWVAVAGVLLFAVHPAHVESVAWITGRKDVLSLLFVALSLLLHVRSRTPFDGRHVASIVLFALAALTKTTTLVLPLWLLILDRLILRRQWREALLRAAAPAAVAAALAVLVLVIWRSSGLTRELPGSGSRAALVLTTMLHYATTMVWPLRLSPVYEIDRSAGFGASALGGMVVVAVLAGAAWWLRDRNRWASAGILLYLAALLPVSNVVPLYFQVNDRYLMLPSLALAFGVVAASVALGKTGSRRAALFAAVGLAIACCAAISFGDSRSWRTDRDLFERATRAQPRAYYAWMKLGEIYRDAGDFEKADEAYLRAIALEPGLVPARGARMLSCLVRHGEGKAVPVARLEKYSPMVGAYMASVGNSQALLSVGLKLHAAGYPACGFAALMEGVQAEPRVPDGTIAGLASDLMGQGRVREACRILEHVSDAARGSSAIVELEKRCAKGVPAQ